MKTPPLEIPMLGAGGLYSTATDMARFVSFQIAGGMAGEHQLLRANTLAELSRPQSGRAGAAGYGLGVSVRPYHGADLSSSPTGKRETPSSGNWPMTRSKP
jgi:CubicO group peptidase (beta-lactamase class C family)